MSGHVIRNVIMLQLERLQVETLSNMIQGSFP